MAQDIGGIACLEHININVPDAVLAQQFYVDVLGLTRDPTRAGRSTVAWINVGRQQFHLPLADEAQVIDGRIGIVVPENSLKPLEERLNAAVKAVPKLADTSFKWTKANEPLPDEFSRDFQCDHSTFIQVTGPWGNTFRFHENASANPRRLGIAYVEFFCEKSSLATIKQTYGFFNAIVGERKEDSGRDSISVTVGARQRLIFTEKADGHALRPYDGHHIAIYVTYFDTTFEAMRKANLIFVNKRFSDAATTLDAAHEISQFRTRDFIDSDTKDTVFQLEHEVRSLHHWAYMRRLINRMTDVTIQGYNHLL